VNQVLERPQPLISILESCADSSKGITESLAGRVAIIDMLGLSAKEIAKIPDNSLPFLPTLEWIERVRKNPSFVTDLNIIYEKIWLGSFPKLLINKGYHRDIFYKSYVQTYLERDIKEMVNITNEITFYKFLRAVATRTGYALLIAVGL
jgi:predicted AAA+ superfamily ATPase